MCRVRGREREQMTKQIKSHGFSWHFSDSSWLRAMCIQLDLLMYVPGKKCREALVWFTQ